MVRKMDMRAEKNRAVRPMVSGSHWMSIKPKGLSHWDKATLPMHTKNQATQPLQLGVEGTREGD